MCQIHGFMNIKAMCMVIMVMAGVSSWNASAGALDLPESQVSAAWDQWRSEIVALTARDAEEEHPDDAVLFIGSSSIRLWDSIKADMAPYHPIQRGYGGARFSDLAVFAEELIAAHRFRGVVVFVANDVTGREDDPEPDQVAEWFRMVAEVALRHQPEAEVFYVEVTPTPSRWHAWNAIKEVNSVIRTLCQGHPRLHYIATTARFLDERGEPRPDYFVGDRLHLNETGYAIWAELIKAELAEVWGREEN